VVVNSKRSVVLVVVIIMVVVVVIVVVVVGGGGWWVMEGGMEGLGYVVVVGAPNYCSFEYRCVVFLVVLLYMFYYDVGGV